MPANSTDAFIENYVVDVMRLWKRLCCNVIMRQRGKKEDAEKRKVKKLPLARKSCRDHRGLVVSVAKPRVVPCGIDLIAYPEASARQSSFVFSRRLRHGSCAEILSFCTSSRDAPRLPGYPERRIDAVLDLPWIKVQRFSRVRALRDAEKSRCS